MVSRGLISPQQLQEAQEARAKILETGVTIGLDEILLRKGLLSPQQLASINAALGKGRTDLIQGYDILSKLGQGGMGAVYKARQISMDRIVAIKVLLPSFAGEKNAVERFLREAHVIAKLSHPNLVSGIDAGYQNGIYYCVMEYVEGKTLAHYLKDGKPVPWKQAVGIVRNVAAALRHAEQRSIVHRDIKPENIIIDTNGVAKLMDLGLAKLAGGRMQSNVSLTGTGLIVGTPYYMSPEQAQAQDDIDIRADIYSLGITLFEALCGRRPFDSDAPLTLLHKHMTERAPYEWLTQAGVPEPVVQVVRKMTAKDRKQRQANAAELIVDLDRALSGKPVARLVPAVRPARPQPKRSRAPVFIGIALALFAGGVVLIALPKRPSPSIVKKPEPEPRPIVPPPAAKEEPKPEPPPPKGEPKASAAENAEAAWNGALAYDNESHTAEDILINYLKVKDQLGGTAFISQVEGKIKHWTPRLDEQIRTESRALESRWSDLKKQDAFAAWDREINDKRTRCNHPLLKALSGLKDYQNWMTFIDDQRSLYRNHLDARMKEIREQAEARLKTNDFEGALEAYKTMRNFDVEPALGEATRELTRIEQEYRTYRNELDRLTAEEPRIIQKHWEEACREAMQRDFEAAVEKLKAAPLRLPPSVQSMDELIRDMDLAGSVPRMVEKDLPPDKTIAAYINSKKNVPSSEQTRALFFYALFTLEAAAAKNEFQKMTKDGVKLRREYEELYLEVQSKAEALKARRLDAESKLKRAERDSKDPKKIDDAVKAFEELLRDYKDVLTEKQIAAIVKRLEELGRGRSTEIVIDAKEFVLKGAVKLGMNERCPLKEVAIIDDGDGPDAASYAEFEIDVKADTPYKLWIYMGYLSSSTNSVTVVFDGDAEIVNPIGDDRGDRRYVVQYYPLEEGFGWSDRDMRARARSERTIDLKASPGPTFKYKTPGRKKIRLHEHEGGCPVARVLVSSGKFITTLPGEAELQKK